MKKQLIIGGVTILLLTLGLSGCLEDSEGNLPPIFGSPSPSNGSTNSPLSLIWSIPINDTEGDAFSWTIECSNGQTNSNIGAANGMKSLSLSGLAYLTTYKVWVNATDSTDSGLYTREWYNFTTETNLFIGKWKTAPYQVYQNGTRYDGIPSNSTFYTNGTMGSEEVIDDEIIWTPYVIENNQICFGEANASDYYCYDYEFSDNGTKAILGTYDTDPYGDTYEFVVEMTKN
jgi:hypothetical protein